MQQEIEGYLHYEMCVRADKAVGKRKRDKKKRKKKKKETKGGFGRRMIQFHHKLIPIRKI